MINIINNRVRNDYLLALNEIINACEKSRMQSKRIQWIKQRAISAIQGNEDYKTMTLRSETTATKEMFALRRKLKKEAKMTGKSVSQDYQNEELKL